jgi:hypothetical protein
LAAWLVLDGRLRAVRPRSEEDRKVRRLVFMIWGGMRLDWGEVYVMGICGVVVRGFLWRGMEGGGVGLCNVPLQA